MYEAHEELRQSAEKREKLERAVRYKLEIEVRRLVAQNKDLKEQNSAALATIARNHHQQSDAPGQIMGSHFSSSQIPLGQQLTNGMESEGGQKRDLLIAQLLVNESKCTLLHWLFHSSVHYSYQLIIFIN